jgi:hypothetical protein
MTSESGLKINDDGRAGGFGKGSASLVRLGMTKAAAVRNAGEMLKINSTTVIRRLASARGKAGVL